MCLRQMVISYFIMRGNYMNRPSKIDYYLSIAEVVSSRSTCLRRHYGAVIVNNDRIISTGYNGSPRGEENCCDKGVCNRDVYGCAKNTGYEKCPAIHAEQNALFNAGRDDCIGATIYVVGKEVSNDSYADGRPCYLCSRYIRNMGLASVIYKDATGNIVEVEGDKI